MKISPTIATYLNVIGAVEARSTSENQASLMEWASRPDRMFGGKPSEEVARATAALEMEALRKARVIDFAESGAFLSDLVYEAVFNAVQKDPTAPATTEDFDRIVEWGGNLPFPADLPFPNVFFGFGEGLPLESEMILARVGRERAGRIFAAWSLGFLVRDTGTIVEYVKVDGLGPTGRSSGVMLMYPKRPGHPWAGVLSLVPFFIHALVHAVHASRGFMVQVPSTFGSRRAFKQEAARQGVRMPPPWLYTVYLRQHLTRRYVSDTLGEPPEKPSWSHRWDVRRHERVRVQRGPLPMDARLKEGLIRRGYVVYDSGFPNPDDALRLHERGHSPRSQEEWVALLVTKIADYIKGPEDLPYVQSSRKVVGERQPQFPEQESP